MNDILKKIELKYKNQGKNRWPTDFDSISSTDILEVLKLVLIKLEDLEARVKKLEKK